MGKIMSIVQSLGGAPDQSSTQEQADGEAEPAVSLPARQEPAAQSESSPAIPDLDPKMIDTAMHLFSAWNSAGNDGKVEVLGALRPYVRRERQEKIDRAVRAVKLAHLAHEALGKFSGEDENG